MPACSLASSVTLAASSVRPWKPPLNATKRERPVSWAATLSAFSLASAPELQKNTESMPLKRTIAAAAASRTGTRAAME